MNKGDLAWLPSEASLVRFDKRGGVVTFKNTGRPKNVLLLEKRDDTYRKIVYNGEQWYVPEHMLYPAREMEEKNDN